MYAVLATCLVVVDVVRVAAQNFVLLLRYENQFVDFVPLQLLWSLYIQFMKFKLSNARVL